MINNIIGFIYLIQIRESIVNNESIYKIGRTQQDGLNRLKNYPNGSKLLLHIICLDSISLEKHLITLFTQLYQRCDKCKLYGSEYFNGDSHEMIQTILNNMDFTCSMDNSYLVTNTIKQLESELHKVKVENESFRNNVQLNNAFHQITELQNQMFEQKCYYENQKILHDTYLKQLEQQFLHSQIDIQKIKNDDKIVDHGNVDIDEDDLKSEVPENKVSNSNVPEHKCKTCFKILSSGQSLKRHVKLCKGVHALQCPLCMKEFTTHQGKYQHLKNVTCTPVNPKHHKQ